MVSIDNVLNNQNVSVRITTTDVYYTLGYKGRERKICIPHFRFPSRCIELPDIGRILAVNEKFTNIKNVTSFVNVVVIFNGVLDV